jgi:LPS-assembly lipoprotein
MKKAERNMFEAARAVSRPVASLLFVTCCVLLVSCGFQLRGASSVTLPPELQLMRVTMGGAGFPPLLVEMRNALLALGNVRLTEDVSAGVPVLQLHAESNQSQVLAIDSNGRISAYLLNYRVDFSLAGADGKPLLDRQPVKMQREFSFDRLNVIATEKQSEFLQNEMRRDATQQILRRLARLNYATANAGAVSPPRAADSHADQR